MECSILPEPPVSAPILRAGTKANLTSILLHDRLLAEQDEHATIRVRKLGIISSETEQVIAVIYTCNLMKIERIQVVNRTKRMLLVRDILEIGTNVPFPNVLVENLLKRPVVLHKQMCIVCISFGIEAPESIEKLERNDESIPAMEANTVLYKE